MSTPDRTDPQGAHPSTSIDDDRRRAIRVLSRNGNSTTISVPPEFLASMQLYPGDVVELVFDTDHRGFFVRTYTQPVHRRKDGRVDAVAAASTEPAQP